MENIRHLINTYHNGKVISYYTWIAKSNDKSFTDEGTIWPTTEQAYTEMRDAVLEKMRWNTEWEDVSENDGTDVIGYEVEFNTNFIIHTSYSGTYRYNIIECDENGNFDPKEWDKLEEELGIKK